MADAIDLLANVPLFRTVPRRELAALARMAHEQQYDAGRHLAEQDEAGTMFFVVVEGEADVLVGGDVRRRLRAGDYFGEMSIIDRAPRSADVVAATPLRCLVFTQWTFRPFLKDHPEVAWGMLEALVQRLRQVEQRAESEERPA